MRLANLFLRKSMRAKRASRVSREEAMILFFPIVDGLPTESRLFDQTFFFIKSFFDQTFLKFVWVKPFLKVWQGKFVSRHYYASEASIVDSCGA